MNSSEVIRSEAIALENVSFKYMGEDSATLNNVTLSFDKEKMHLILGSSGCGKTTLLYALDGLLETSIEGQLEGNIRFSDDVASAGISLIFQNPDNGFCTFTVEDEIAFGLENMNVAPTKIKESISNALEKVGMVGTENKMLSTLSGGEKQKIAIACGIALNSAVYIFDEPTANLDSTSRKEISEILFRLKAEEQKTIIIVEHNLNEIMSFVDTISLIDENGKIRLTGKRDQIITKLLFDKELVDFPVLLPEELQLIRSWICDNKNNKVVTDYADNILNAEVSRPLEKVLEDIKIKMFYKSSYIDIYETKSEKRVESKEDAIKISGLKFKYPGMKNWLLQCQHLDIKKGEFTAIVGPNGIGKSTLVNIIIKNIEKIVGDVYIDETELKKISKKELYKKTGLVFQNPDWQFVTNNLEDEILFSLKNSEKNEEEKKRTVDAVLERFSLSSVRNKSPFELSQGQKRRLSVAVMLLTEQKILILDEPTYGQDYDNRLELMDLLASLNREGLTVVMITHEMDIVAQYADSVICVEEDKLVKKISVEQFFADEALLETVRQEAPRVYNFSLKMKEIFNSFEPTYSYETCRREMFNIVLDGGCDV